jgi:hypothetical protein
VVHYFGYDHGEDDLIAREHKEEIELGFKPGWWKPILMYILATVVVLGGLTLCGVVRAEEIKESAAINAILGEARGEGEASMLAHAHAIRNRGTLKGVYGAKAEHTYKVRRFDVHKKKMVTHRVKEVILPELYQRAAKAWHTSLDTPDPTDGATHWLSSQDIDKMMEKPKRWETWNRELEPTLTVGNTTFYRKRRPETDPVVAR